MTLREAVIQAHIELGKSREEAELRAKLSNGLIPDAAALAESPVKPGQEREFIEGLKQVFRKVDANPQAVQDVLRIKMGKRAQQN